MKCPHCHKLIDTSELSKQNKEDVYNEICKEAHSIASITRKLKIKRSSIRYYINQLLIEGRISEERLENLAGRPTILRVKEPSPAYKRGNAAIKRLGERN